MRYTRVELGAMLDARRRNGLAESQGEGAFLEFRLRISPELLDHILGASITMADGRVGRIEAVHVNGDGYVEPVMDWGTYKAVAEAPADRVSL